MFDFPISTNLKTGYLARAVRAYGAFQTKRQAQAESRERNEVLRELNSTQLRDIGYVRDKSLDTGKFHRASEQAKNRAKILDMTF